MPAELRDFDPREWAAPGEEPDEAAWPGFPDDDWYRREFDRIHCHQRYTAELIAWFDAHPDADFLEWINGKRAVRRSSLL
jgi:hypothetical protein